MRLINGECLEEMDKLIEQGIKVDVIITDPPYGTIKGLGGDIEKYKRLSNSNWDISINPIDIFERANKLLRKNGKIVLFSQEPYSNQLLNLAIPNMPFSYKLYWDKKHFSNCLLANKAPVSYIEEILVFSKNYQKHDFEGTHPLREYALKIKKHINYSRLRLFKELGNGGVQHFLESNKESTQFSLCVESAYNFLISNYGINKENWFIEYKELQEINKKYRDDLIYKMNTEFPSVFNLPEGKKYKSNILEYKKDYTGFHPTQKPVLLMEDLIKTYTNEGETVLDFTAGSFSTGVACVNTNREFIGIELDKGYYDIGVKRINDVKS